MVTFCLKPTVIYGKVKKGQEQRVKLENKEIDDKRHSNYWLRLKKNVVFYVIFQLYNWSAVAEGI